MLNRLSRQISIQNRIHLFHQNGIDPARLRSHRRIAFRQVDAKGSNEDDSVSPDEVDNPSENTCKMPPRSVMTDGVERSP